MPARWPISRTPRGRPGLTTTMIDIEDIGWRDDGGFVDLDNRDDRTRLQALSLGMDVPRRVRRKLVEAPTRWIEPPWKAILSNKGILPLLWEMFPGPSQSAAGLFRG